MSTGTVVADRHQIGLAGTTTQKFSLEVPSTPDGTMALKRGLPGAGTSVLSVDAANSLTIPGGLTVNTGLNVSTLSGTTRLALASAGVAGTTVVQMDASAGGNLFDGLTNGSRVWTLQMPTGPGGDFVIARWNPTLISIPVTVSYATGAMTLTVAPTAPGFNWNASGGGPGLYSSGYSVSGAFRAAVLSDTGSVGDTSNIITWHQPGVITFVRMAVGGSGNVFEFYNDGVGRSSGGWTTISDNRTKYDAVPIGDALGKVGKLKGYTYIRPDMTPYNGDMPRRAGLLAQEVLAQLPETVMVPKNYDPVKNQGDLLSLEYGGVLGLLVNAVNELHAKVQHLEEKCQCTA